MHNILHTKALKFNQTHSLLKVLLLCKEILAAQHKYT